MTCNSYQNLDPLGQVLTPIHNDFIPGLRLLLDSLAVSEPANVYEVGCNRIEFLEPLCGTGHPRLVNKGERNAPFPQRLNKLGDEPILVSDFDGELVILRQFHQEWTKTRQ